MLWEHPGTQKMFIRETDKLVSLRHKNADEYRSEVVHIPKHAVESIRPGKYGYRIDILFRRTKAVVMPEDLAKWVLDKFKYVYEVKEEQAEQREQGTKHNEKDPDNSSAPFDLLNWNELREIGRERKVFKVGMNREKLIEALNDISTSS